MTIRGTVLAVTLLLFGWVGILLGVTLLSDDAPAALVLFPDKDFLAQVPEDVAVLNATPYSVTLTSGETGLAYSTISNWCLVCFTCRPSWLYLAFVRKRGSQADILLPG